ncbi:MAG: hypothetical protein ACRC1G_08995 [Bradyrhizobium sp.]
MKTRAAIFVVALIASILSSAGAFAAPDPTEERADTCLTSPREYTPPGTRWRYKMERGTGRRCWFLKDEAEKAAGKPAGQSTATADEPAPAPQRRKPAASPTVSDARAEFSRTPVEPETRPAPIPGDPAATAADTAAKMLAPGAATRWPGPMSTGSGSGRPAPPAAAPGEQSAELRAAPAVTPPPAKPQAMPRAVPPAPVSEKPMSLPMLITVAVAGLSVLGVLVSMLLAWRASRRARLSPSAPMPPLEMPDQQLRPGELYRERKRLHAQRTGRRAA